MYQSLNVLRVSDRLPIRRRSGGGKHVATRAVRLPLTRLAHAGVATTMVAGLVLVVVNPAGGDTAAANASSGTATAAGPADHAAWLGLQQDWLAERDATREDIAGVATQAVAQVADVKAKAQQADVPADQIAALDTLQQQVDQLVTKVRDSTVVRVSRSGERLLDDAAPAADPTAQPAASAQPAPSSDAASSGTATAAAPDATTTDSPTPAASDAASSDTTAPDETAATPAGSQATAALDVTDAAAVDAAMPTVSTAEDSTAAALRAAVVALAQQVAQVDAAADAAEAAAAAAAQTAADEAAKKAAEKASLDGYANGRIPSSALCALSFDSSALLRCDAAEAMDQLDAAYKAQFGSDLTITDSYRSYAAQVACRRTKGSLCAVPGTSNHGLGVAVDFGGTAHTFGTVAHKWLEVHAAEFGWHLPDWAQAGGSKPEPWHWEYTG